MIFPVNPLLADDSNEVASLIWVLRVSHTFKITVNLTSALTFRKIVFRAYEQRHEISNNMVCATSKA